MAPTVVPSDARVGACDLGPFLCAAATGLGASFVAALPAEGSRSMSAKTSSVNALISLNGTKMCVKCERTEFALVETFDGTTFVCASRCSHNYEKDCPCPGTFCAHTPLRSQCA